MLNLSFEDIVKQICTTKNVSESEVLAKVKEKKATLRDLVSDEGAAYIIASEMGVNLLSGMPKKKIQIKDALIGMRGVNITGKVMQVFDIKEFKTKDGKSGKVGAFVIADETGKARVVLWNDQAPMISKAKIGDIVKVTNTFVKENKMSGKEFHVGTNGIIEPSEEEIKIDISASSAPSDSMQSIGTIVQAYRPAFYAVCKECGASLSDGKCPTHPDGEKKKEMVLSFMVDNGEKCLRCVSFKNTAEKIAKINATDAEKIIIDKNEAALQEYVDGLLLGEQVKVNGRTKFNQSFNREEILINTCELANASEAIKSFEK